MTFLSGNVLFFSDIFPFLTSFTLIEENLAINGVSRGTGGGLLGGYQRVAYLII
ncbi:Uncharacterised protein [Yersinia intermedia]|jgi:hypothetical protein|nr:Uncharacterised protein [Yersinia intermedia]CNG49182.1 Uncharacterised protein [Yersinia intermedia]